MAGVAAADPTADKANAKAANIAIIALIIVPLPLARKRNFNRQKKCGQLSECELFHTSVFSKRQSTARSSRGDGTHGPRVCFQGSGINGWLTATSIGLCGLASWRPSRNESHPNSTDRKSTR